MDGFNGYSQATQRRIFALKNNIELVRLWVNAQATLNVYDQTEYFPPEVIIRAQKTIELCEYTLTIRGLCMTLDGDKWTDGPIPAPPTFHQSELPF